MNVTQKLTSRNHEYANTYAGELTLRDFCTDYADAGCVIKKIFAARYFDRRCLQNAKVRDRRRAYVKSLGL